MTASASAFSSSETSALERQTEVEEAAVTLDQIWSETQQTICSNWVRQNGYQRVCLQFPDSYLPHSNAISDGLKCSLAECVPEVKVFILADTSYGSCCVDEIAAAHVEADSLIHFGHACRSKVSRLPVLYMFPQLPIDMAQFYQQLETLKQTCVDKELHIYLDIGYHQLLEQHLNEHATDDESVSSKLKSLLPCKNLLIEAYPPAEDVHSIATETARICIFVGGDNARFANLSLTSCGVEQWHIYDASTNCLQAKNPLTAQYIRRRYYYIEKCKDAQTLGLIVATLSAQGYLEVIARLQELAKRRGIKTQIISVGRINPAKLANFLEIDCFVLIGCPFNSGYNSKEYYKPLVSVFEAEMALNPAWHMKYPEAYVTDFKQLLPEGRSFLAYDGDSMPEQDVSLVSGRLRNTTADCAEPELANTAALSEQQRALVTQGKMELMTSNTGLTFEDRTWRGLDPALGTTEPAKLQRGLKGIPISYTHDD